MREWCGINSTQRSNMKYLQNFGKKNRKVLLRKPYYLWQDYIEKYVKEN
jgi:hypothetical protein